MPNLPEDPFHTTRWSLVLRSRSDSDGESLNALNELCQLYWIPIFGYIRRRTASNEEAEDLTQAYFARLLEKEYLHHADPDRGKLRAFLLTDLRLFLSNERDRANAQKRKGSAPDLSIDFSEFPETLSEELVDAEAPDQWFDRQWAMRVFETAIHRLQEDYENRGRAELFERIKPCLEGADPGEADEIAADLGISANNVKQQIFRLRQRFRMIFRGLIADTVDSEEEVDQEIRHLTSSLRK